MGKIASPAAAVLAQREKQAEAFVNGGTLLEPDDTADSVETTASENGDELEDSQTKTGGAAPNVKPAKNTKQARITAASQVDRRRKNGIIVEHPALRKALARSRVQKTIRIPPMLMVEYEEVCSRLEIEVDFNNHINEALSLWIEKRNR